MYKWILQPSYNPGSNTSYQLSDSDLIQATSSNINSNKRSHDEVNESSKKKKGSWVRQYFEHYIQFGFTEGTDNKPLCVICNVELANESMKPSKLQRHLELRHPEYRGQPKEFFVNMKRELNDRKKDLDSMLPQPTQAHNLALVSYELSQLIATSGYPHVIGEKIILPSLKIVASRLFEEKQQSQVNQLTLSNNTIRRRIVDIADDIEKTVVNHLKSCHYFSLQVDESIDISDNANLICFVRYDFNNTINEELLFCKALPTRTTVDEIFNLINNYINENNIEWKKCVGLSSDGVRALSGIRTGVYPKIKVVAPECVWTHCSIHREALAVKTMPLQLRVTMEECVKFINYIKSRPNSRLLSILCKEMGNDHEHLLLYCEIQWLSRGNVLKRLIELKEEVKVFLEQHPPKAKDTIFDFKDRFHDVNWLAKVAYLSDIFEFLNNLNVALQGNNVTIFKVHEKVEAAIKKLNVWSQRAETGNFNAFSNLSEIQKDCNMTALPQDISIQIKEHLLHLETNLGEYFPPIDANRAWIRNPFTFKLDSETNLPDSDVDSLIEMSTDTALKDIFDTSPLIDFWLSCRKEYTHLSHQAITFLMPFVTTYKCEAGLSTLVYLKNKYKNRLEVEPNLRIKLSSFSPNLDSLVQNKKQLHTSH